MRVLVVRVLVVRGEQEQVVLQGPQIVVGPRVVNHRGDHRRRIVKNVLVDQLVGMGPQIVVEELLGVEVATASAAPRPQANTCRWKRCPRNSSAGALPPATIVTLEAQSPLLLGR